MATVSCDHQIFQNIQAVVFDKDGTLARSESYLYQVGSLRVELLDTQVPGVGKRLAQALGLRQPNSHPPTVHPAGILAVASRQVTEFAAAAYVTETGWTWPEALDLVQAAFSEAELVLQPKSAYTPLIEGVFQLVQRLFQADIRMAIVSADTTDNIWDFIRRYELDAYVQFAAGADQEFQKPDPRLLYQTCQALAVAPEQTLVIGDADTDMRMARSAHAAGAIGVTWGWIDPPQLQQATIVIHHPTSMQVRG
ncbi:hypothetical protein BST81_23395 [Leptolyngbya sp. 'hensonii']|uniref:HAD family hydrolase n=1 Tax=Leptolyngbya sp. 'hensonii' TaxID=1922337 RepID=UPI00094FA489|nr:HAD family hydrolase [Leptolyngbya sp. 'hensonii']OLP16006.1 hypothetical protein BST81_23395 [Leptolyngbya sp. 'hensonii']